MNVLEVDEKADDLKMFIRSYSPRLFKTFVFKLCFPISPHKTEESWLDGSPEMKCYPLLIQ